MDMRYIAGFFDGEGCIGIYDSSRGYMVVMVTVVQNDRTILEELQAKFGGYFRKHRNQNCSMWTVSAQKAERFLWYLLPYLRLKKQQAKIALAARWLAGEVGPPIRPSNRDLLLHLKKQLHEAKIF